MALVITPAVALLQQRMKERDLTQQQVADICDVNQSRISEWLRCLGRPDLQQRKVLEAALSIPENDWLTLDERASIDRAVARASELSEPASENDPVPTSKPAA